MKRILVFCARDWLNPQAGRVEQYVHEVCVRLAAQCNYVAWVAQSFPLFGHGVRRPRTELVDGIQIARLGMRPLYRLMAGMFLARIEKTNNGPTRFDAIIDCVTGYPLPITEKTQIPVVPLVFNLSPKIQASEEPPGPVIAATDEARRQLLRAGFPESFIVQAVDGMDGMDAMDEAHQHHLGSDARQQLWDKTTEIILATIEDVVHSVH